MPTDLSMHVITIDTFKDLHTSLFFSIQESCKISLEALSSVARLLSAMQLSHDGGLMNPDLKLSTHLCIVP